MYTNSNAEVYNQLGFDSLSLRKLEEIYICNLWPPLLSHHDVTFFKDSHLNQDPIPDSVMTHNSIYSSISFLITFNLHHSFKL